MLLPEINSRINNVRKTIRRLFLINGLTHLIIFIAVFSIATFIIDWFVPDLPRGVRISFLLIGFGVLCYLFFRYLFYPLNKPITDEDIAICVEKIYPDLKERLISSLQLNRTLSQSDNLNSPELVRVLINETNRAVQPLDFKRILNTLQIKKLLALMLGLVLMIIIMYSSFNPLYASIWFNRILGGDVRWPKKTLLKVIVKKDMIAKGQDVNIGVIVVKGLPKRVYLHYEFEAGEKGWERMTKTNPREFNFAFRRVHSSFRFYVRGGDDQTEWQTIKALTPPRLERIQIWYEYPSYTKLSNTPPSQPEIGGMVRAPVGTKVKLVSFANIPLVFAQLTLGKKSYIEVKSLPIEEDILGEPKKIIGRFTVTTNSEYMLTLKAHNGLENIEPVRYPIKVIVDTAPTIKIVEPKRDTKQITPIATVPIKLLSKDDYGINRLTLFHKVLNRELPETRGITFTSSHNDAPYGSRQIETNYNFEISELGVKEGDIIGYFIEGEDNCAISQTNTTKTRQFRFIVVSAAQLQKKIEETEMRIKEEVKKTLKLQERVRKELNNNKEMFADKDKFTAAEKRSLRRNLTTQRRVTQVMERITREFDEVINDIVINKLWDTATRDKLNSINMLLKDVGNDKSPRASDLIARLINLPNPSNRETSFHKAQNLQNQIIYNLKNALAKMEEWEDYQEVIRIVRELLQKQTKIVEELKR